MVGLVAAPLNLKWELFPNAEILLQREYWGYSIKFKIQMLEKDETLIDLS